MHAQVERASILGNATDNSSAAVPNVVVTVTNEATNTSVRVVTDAAGAFAVMNLIPVRYLSLMLTFADLCLRLLLITSGHKDLIPNDIADERRK